jgi:hypothetical protein
MIRRLSLLVAATMLALGMLAAPSFAAQPNVDCLRTGVSVLKANPDVRASFAKSGQLGTVIADHLSADAGTRYPWCAS